MGKIKSCAISLHGQKEVYREGELVSGVVVLDVLEPVTAKSIRIYCYGQSLTKWSREFTRDWNSNNIGSEKYFGHVVTLAANKGKEETVQLTVGVHRWKFSFRLPGSNLPSSFEGEYGAVRWWLKVEVDKPFPFLNNTWYKAFTVLSKLNLNEAVYQAPMKQSKEKLISKNLGIGNAGQLSLTAKTDKFGYCPGEAISLFIEAKNNSTKDLGKISIILVQQTTFKANDEQKTTSIGLVPMETEVTVGKGQTITLDALQIKIPAVPPSTRKNTCHIICVTYMIKVTVQIPWGFNLDVGLPIAIGTIPRRKSTQAPQQSSAFELDARDTITYTRCEFGITPCTKSHENFVNFPYTPMCAYVPEGSLGLPTLPQAAAAAAAAPSTKPQKQQQAAKESKRDGQIHVSGGAMAPAHPLNPSLPLASPPTYEDVLKMDQEGQARTPQAASPMKLSPPREEDLGSGGPWSANKLEVDGKANKRWLSSLPPLGLPWWWLFEGDHETIQASPVLPEPAMDPCAFLLMRFPDLLLADFRNLLQQEHDCLEEYNASVVAIAPQVITQHASSSRVWPERTAVAVLIFPAMTTAEEWFSSLASRNLTWLNNCDTVLSPGKWHYPTEDRLSFSLTTLQRKDNIAEEEVKTYLKNNASPYAEFRKKCRGILPFSSSKDLKTLSGTWLTPGVDTLVLGAWPSLSSYFTYKEMSSSYASEHPSPYDNLAVIFVSENTAWFNAKAASAAQDVCNGASSHDDNSNDADAEKEEKAEDVLSESEKFRGVE